MKRIGVSGIIHGFALLHAAVALCCRLAGVVDELLLTLLTMTMTMLICLKRGRSVEFTAASIIIVNITGYLLGLLWAGFFSLFTEKLYLVHAMSTFITTEILGWGMAGILTLFKRKEGSGRQMSATHLTWIISAMLVIFVIRLGINLLFAGEAFDSQDMTLATRMILSNSLSLIMLLCLNIIYIRGRMKYPENISATLRICILALFICLTSFFEALFVRIGLPPDFKDIFDHMFIIIIIASAITQVTLLCMVFIANEAVTAKGKMKMERDKASLAQYRYLKLKRQVDPHFLFNSLNALDCLICEEKTQQASRYTHKLAGIYRYMLRSEDEDLVTLREELVFAGLYTDLLKVRFPQGLEVETDIPEQDNSRFVLPCAIQLLIENATKHNAVNPDNPLKIKISSDGTNITIINNIVPKFTGTASTGLGHKYIRQRYLDLSGKDITILRTQTEYSVTLPLL